MPDYSENTELNGLEVAVIGMAGRFPGAQNIAQFWDNLCRGVESLTVLTDEALATAGVPPEEYSDPQYVKVARILENEDLFDAAFFGYTPREAAVMDPQQRLFLECSREALEHAGYAPEMLDVPVGVFGGAKTNTYLLNLFFNRRPVEPLDIVQITVGNDLAGLTTNVSYKLDLTGPSYAFHTHCSTSLVAVHLACQSLLLGECHMALAGGVAIDVPQRKGYLYQPVNIFSPDGRCRAFDARARGFIFGNGLGIVVLKRLQDALADGDTIYALIKGSATNNDGAAKASYTAPGVDGQTAVIMEALANAEVPPETISYIETHGTGTPLGDAIEIRGLSRVFGNDGRSSIAIGSVKTNVGHLGAAAGVTGLIKTILSLEKKQLPPSLNFEEPNPEINFASTPFYVNTGLKEWEPSSHPRRAGVSSFGFGSTNAHVVVEEALPVPPSDPARPWQLLVLSAKTPTALAAATTNLTNYLKQNEAVNLADVAYTLQVGRTPFNYRSVLLCRDRQDALQVLEKKSSRLLTGEPMSTDASPVFLFPGLGDHYAGMAQELYDTEPVFREQMDACADLLQSLLGIDLRTLLYPAARAAGKSTETAVAPGAGRQFDLRQMLNRAAPAGADSSPLQQPSQAHPILFAVEYALARLWQSWGIPPQAMIGYSLGEYVAACLAGVFSLEDALRIVTERARLVETLPEGAMLTVPLAEEEVRPLLGPTLSLAIISGPSLCVVAGPPADVAQLKAELATQGKACQYLKATHAIHSKMMQPVTDRFTQIMQQVSLNAPQIPYLSNLTGTWITAVQATDPRYWSNHLCQTVRFWDGVQELMQTPQNIFIEVGPGETISTLIRQYASNAEMPIPLTLSSLPYSYDQQSDRAFLLHTLGQLWLAGVPVHWQKVHARQRRTRIPLPTYPFERQRYWIDPPEETGPSPATLPKSGNMADWFYLPSWKKTMPPLAGEQRSRRWMLFANDDSFSKKLGQQLRAQGYEVVTIRPGSQFQREGDDYTVRPGSRTDYDTLQSTLHAQQYLPTDVVHLWNTGPQPGDIAQALDRSFYSLLFIAQVIGEQNIRTNLKLTVISTHLQQVSGTEVVHPAKAPLLGICQVLPQEMPNVTCCHIDVVLPPPQTGQEAQLLEQLVTELQGDTEDEVIAYRGRDRWVQTTEPAPLPAVKKEIPRLRQEGVYLITGGLGGIGLELAAFLVRTVQAKVVLTTRSQFPAAATWDQWLATQGEQDKTSKRIRKVKALKALGGEVLIVQADVTNQEQMKTAVTQARGQFGAIHGVIHAAGLPGGGLIALKTKEEAARILAPKVQGTQILEAVLQETPPDFMVLCSSLLALVGGIGQVDYCAANAFLDAFARARNTSDTAVVSINWDIWQEVGFWDEQLANTSQEGESSPVAPSLLQSNLKQALKPEEGVELFQRILAYNHLPQIAVSTQPLSALRQQIREVWPAQLLQTTPRADIANARHKRPDLETEYVAPRNDVEEKLAGLWQNLLGIEKVSIHDSFFELGGHSLLMTQLRNHLFETFGMELSIRLLFQNERLVDMAQLIRENEQAADDAETPIGEQLQAAFPTERQKLLEKYLRQQLIQMSRIEPEQPERLQAYNLKLTSLVDLMWKLKQELNLYYYPPEVRAHTAVSELAQAILTEIERLDDLARFATGEPLSAYRIKPFREGADVEALLAPPSHKNAHMVFLHSSPRSGSTLLRIMLAGHPGLFCPPEINLLPYRDMEEWQQETGFHPSDFQWPAQGLHAAFTELLHLKYEEGWHWLQELVARNETVQAVYGRLQQLAGERLLIDKTPSYWRDLTSLRRGELLFEAPKYIFLVRHPYAVIDSILRMRLDRVLGPTLFREEDVDPYIIAETIWALSARNLLRFSEEVGPDRCFWLRYEALVRDPAAKMEALCRFLNLPFDEALLTPYDGRRQRMIGGLGDPGILQHKEIDASIADAWKKINLPRPLDPGTRQLAERLDYEIPGPLPEGERVGSRVAMRLEREETLQTDLNQLSDEEVTRMLGKLLSEEKE